MKNKIITKSSYFSIIMRILCHMIDKRLHKPALAFVLLLCFSNIQYTYIFANITIFFLYKIQLYIKIQQL